MSETEVEVKSAEGPRLFPYLPTEPIEGDHIYVSTFALAWRKLRELAGGEVRVEGAPAWLDAVAVSAISEADVPPKTLVAVAGFGPPAIEEVRREMNATFGAEAESPVLPALAEDGLLVFAHLQVGLEFEEPFELEKREGMLFGDVRVKRFGCQRIPDRWREVAKQVVVHHYRSETDFVIEILTKNEATRLLVARTPGQTGMADCVAHSINQAGLEKPDAATGSQKLLMHDSLWIPLVRIKEVRRYHELVGRHICNDRDLGPIAAMVQDVKLLLDERGVSLLSSFVVVANSITLRPARRIVCDGPFLLIVIRNGSTEPLAAAAIETARWLVPIGEPDDVTVRNVVDSGRTYEIEDIFELLGHKP
ncbi:MAG: hypothetical protein ABJE95_00875 [Byssovorax sp.]